MMTTIISQTIFMVMCSMMKNPMKMSFWMIMICFLIMFNIFVMSGKSWAPNMMLMLFMGGILLMFMVLSSTLPNEKMKKSKMKWMNTMTILITTLTISYSIMSITETENMEKMKLFITDGINMIFMTSVMVLYFSLFLFLMKSNKNSMRSSI